MPSILLEYRLRIRTLDDSADALVVTSVRGDASAWLSSVPQGDGTSLDHPTGKVQAGVYSARVTDALTGPATRVLTSLLEDAIGRPQYGLRKGYYEFRDGSFGNIWLTLGAGLVTKINQASSIEWDVQISEAMAIEHQGTSFAPKTAIVTATANAAIGATSLAIAALPFFLPSGTTLVFANTKGATLTADAAAGATSLSVSALAQAISTGDGANATESIAAFLARWPNRGCLFGGPVRGGFLTQADLGGWQMQITAIDAPSGIRALAFRKGYGPPSGQYVMDGAGEKPYFRSTIDWTNDVTQVMPAVNKAADAFYVGRGGLLNVTEFHTIEETRRAYAWRSLVVELIDPTTLATVGFFQPAQIARFNGEDAGTDGTYRQIGRAVGNKATSSGGMFIGTSLAVSGTIYRVRLFAIEACERSPIYWTGHPVDYMAALWGEQNLSFDAGGSGTSHGIEGVRETIGRQQRISVRKTAPAEMGRELEATCYGPFGIGVRMNGAGQLQPFASRIFLSAAPSVVLADADVVDDTTRLGELDTNGAIRRVIVTQQRLVKSEDAAAAGFDTTDALDGFLVQSETDREENGDPAAISQVEQSYTVPGMIHLVNQQPNLVAFTQQLAKTLFDRRGRGYLGGATTALRGAAGDGLSIGDEALIAVKQLPSKGKRYGDDNTIGARRMQVVRLTATPEGKELELEDSGPNANAVATVPTISIAQSTDFPRSVAELTITNGATLNALALGLRVRVATAPSGSPAIPDYADFIAYRAGLIPTGPIRLPQTFAGYVVSAIVRAEQIGAQPGAYTSAASVTLATMNPPTSVSVTPSGSDGSKAAVAWTTGSGMTDCATDVYLRTQGAAAGTAIRQAKLEPGSTQYQLQHLTPGALYTATVEHRDRVTGDLSSVVDVNFTAGGTTTTLPVPLYPQAYAGSQAIQSLTDGVYGLSVWGAVYPSFVEFWEAVETSVLSGTYGTAVVARKIATVQNDWTTFSSVAPNDGLRRQLTARHIRDGANNSSFTAAVTVTPWAPKRRPLSPPTRLIPYADDAQYAATADLSGQVFLNGAGVSSTQKVNIGTPSTPATMQRIYRVPFSAFTPHASASAAAYDRTNGWLQPGTANVNAQLSAPVVLPQGSTITSFLIRAFKTNLGDAVEMDLYRCNDGATPLALGTAILSATAAWTTVTVGSLSEAVNASYLYILRLGNFKGVAATSDARFSYAEITVTVPDLNTGL